MEQKAAQRRIFGVKRTNFLKRMRAHFYYVKRSPFFNGNLSVCPLSENSSMRFIFLACNYLTSFPYTAGGDGNPPLNSTYCSLPRGCPSLLRSGAWRGMFFNLLVMWLVSLTCNTFLSHVLPPSVREDWPPRGILMPLVFGVIFHFLSSKYCAVICSDAMPFLFLFSSIFR